MSVVLEVNPHLREGDEFFIYSSIGSIIYFPSGREEETPFSIARLAEIKAAEEARLASKAALRAKRRAHKKEAAAPFDEEEEISSEALAKQESVGSSAAIKASIKEEEPQAEPAAMIRATKPKRSQDEIDNAVLDAAIRENKLLNEEAKKWAFVEKKEGRAIIKIASSQADPEPIVLDKQNALHEAWKRLVSFRKEGRIPIKKWDILRQHYADAASARHRAFEANKEAQKKNPFKKGCANFTKYQILRESLRKKGENNKAQYNRHLSALVVAIGQFKTPKEQRAKKTTNMGKMLRIQGLSSFYITTEFEGKKEVHNYITRAGYTKNGKRKANQLAKLYREYGDIHAFDKYVPVKVVAFDDDGNLIEVDLKEIIPETRNSKKAKVTKEDRRPKEDTYKRDVLIVAKFLVMTRTERRKYLNECSKDIRVLIKNMKEDVKTNHQNLLDRLDLEKRALRYRSARPTLREQQQELKKLAQLERKKEIEEERYLKWCVQRNRRLENEKLFKEKTEARRQLNLQKKEEREKLKEMAHVAYLARQAEREAAAELRKFAQKPRKSFKTRAAAIEHFETHSIKPQASQEFGKVISAEQMTILRPVQKVQQEEYTIEVNQIDVPQWPTQISTLPPPMVAEKAAPRMRTDIICTSCNSHYKSNEREGLFTCPNNYCDRHYYLGPEHRNTTRSVLVRTSFHFHRCACGTVYSHTCDLCFEVRSTVGGCPSEKCKKFFGENNPYHAQTVQFHSNERPYYKTPLAKGWQEFHNHVEKAAYLYAYVNHSKGEFDALDVQTNIPLGKIEFGDKITIGSPEGPTHTVGLPIQTPRNKESSVYLSTYSFESDRNYKSGTPIFNERGELVSLITSSVGNKYSLMQNENMKYVHTLVTQLDHGYIQQGHHYLGFTSLKVLPPINMQQTVKIGSKEFPINLHKTIGYCQFPDGLIRVEKMSSITSEDLIPLGTSVFQNGKRVSLVSFYNIHLKEYYFSTYSNESMTFSNTQIHNLLKTKPIVLGGVQYGTKEDYRKEQSINGLHIIEKTDGTQIQLVVNKETVFNAHFTQHLVKSTPFLHCCNTWHSISFSKVGSFVVGKQGSELLYEPVANSNREGKILGSIKSFGLTLKHNSPLTRVQFGDTNIVVKLSNLKIVGYSIQDGFNFVSCRTFESDKDIALGTPCFNQENELCGIIAANKEHLYGVLEVDTVPTTINDSNIEIWQENLLAYSNVKDAKNYALYQSLDGGLYRNEEKISPAILGDHHYHFTLKKDDLSFDEAEHGQKKGKRLRLDNKVVAQPVHVFGCDHDLGNANWKNNHHIDICRKPGLFKEIGNHIRLTPNGKPIKVAGKGVFMTSNADIGFGPVGTYEVGTPRCFEYKDNLLSGSPVYNMAGELCSMITGSYSANGNRFYALENDEDRYESVNKLWALKYRGNEQRIDLKMSPFTLFDCEIDAEDTATVYRSGCQWIKPQKPVYGMVNQMHSFNVWNVLGYLTLFLTLTLTAPTSVTIPRNLFDDHVLHMLPDNDRYTIQNTKETITALEISTRSLTEGVQQAIKGLSRGMKYDNDSVSEYASLQDSNDIDSYINAEIPIVNKEVATLNSWKKLMKYVKDTLNADDNNMVAKLEQLIQNKTTIQVELDEMKDRNIQLRSDILALIDTCKQTISTMNSLTEDLRSLVSGIKSSFLELKVLRRIINSAYEHQSTEYDYDSMSKREVALAAREARDSVDKLREAIRGLRDVMQNDGSVSEAARAVYEVVKAPPQQFSCTGMNYVKIESNYYVSGTNEIHVGKHLMTKGLFSRAEALCICEALRPFYSGHLSFKSAECFEELSSFCTLAGITCPAKFTTSIQQSPLNKITFSLPSTTMVAKMMLFLLLSVVISKEKGPIVGILLSSLIFLSPVAAQCDLDGFTSEVVVNDQKMHKVTGTWSKGDCIQFGNNTLSVEDIAFSQAYEVVEYLVDNYHFEMVSEYGCPKVLGMGQGQEVCKKELKCKSKSNHEHSYCTSAYNERFYGTDCADSGEMYINTRLCANFTAGIHRLVAKQNSVLAAVQLRDVSSDKVYVLNSVSDITADYYLKGFKVNGIQLPENLIRLGGIIYELKDTSDVAVACKCNSNLDCTLMEPNCIKPEITQIENSIKINLRPDHWRKNIGTSRVPKIEGLVWEANVMRLNYNASSFSAEIYFHEQVFERTIKKCNTVRVVTSVINKGVRGNYNPSTVRVTNAESNCLLKVSCSQCSVVSGNKLLFRSGKVTEIDVLCGYYSKTNCTFTNDIEKQEVVIEKLNWNPTYPVNKAAAYVMKRFEELGFANVYNSISHRLHQVKDFMEGLIGFTLYTILRYILIALGIWISIQLFLHGHYLIAISIMSLCALPATMGQTCVSWRSDCSGMQIPKELCFKHKASIIHGLWNLPMKGKLNCNRTAASEAYSRSKVEYYNFVEEYCKHGAHFGYTPVEYVNISNDECTKMSVFVHTCRYEAKSDCNYIEQTSTTDIGKIGCSGECFEPLPNYSNLHLASVLLVSLGILVVLGPVSFFCYIICFAKDIIEFLLLIMSSMKQTASDILHYLRSDYETIFTRAQPLSLMIIIIMTLIKKELVVLGILFKLRSLLDSISLSGSKFFLPGNHESNVFTVLLSKWWPKKERETDASEINISGVEYHNAGLKLRFSMLVSQMQERGDDEINVPIHDPWTNTRLFYAHNFGNGAVIAPKHAVLNDCNGEEYNDVIAWFKTDQIRNEVVDVLKSKRCVPHSRVPTSLKKGDSGKIIQNTGMFYMHCGRLANGSPVCSLCYTECDYHHSDNKIKIEVTSTDTLEGNTEEVTAKFSRMMRQRSRKTKDEVLGVARKRSKSRGKSPMKITPALLNNAIADVKEEDPILKSFFRDGKKLYQYSGIVTDKVTNVGVSSKWDTAAQKESYLKDMRERAKMGAIRKTAAIKHDFLPKWFTDCFKTEIIVTEGVPLSKCFEAMEISQEEKVDIINKINDYIKKNLDHPTFEASDLQVWKKLALFIGQVQKRRIVKATVNQFKVEQRFTKNKEITKNLLFVLEQSDPLIAKKVGFTRSRAVKDSVIDKHSDDVADSVIELLDNYVVATGNIAKKLSKELSDYNKTLEEFIGQLFIYLWHDLSGIPQGTALEVASRSDLLAESIRSASQLFLGYIDDMTESARALSGGLKLEGTHLLDSILKEANLDAIIKGYCNYMRSIPSDIKEVKMFYDNMLLLEKNLENDENVEEVFTPDNVVEPDCDVVITPRNEQLEALKNLVGDPNLQFDSLVPYHCEQEMGFIVPKTVYGNTWLNNNVTSTIGVIRGIKSGNCWIHKGNLHTNNHVGYNARIVINYHSDNDGGALSRNRRSNNNLYTMTFEVNTARDVSQGDLNIYDSGVKKIKLPIVEIGELCVIINPAPIHSPNGRGEWSTVICTGTTTIGGKTANIFKHIDITKSLEDDDHIIRQLTHMEGCSGSPIVNLKGECVGTWGYAEKVQSVDGETIEEAVSLAPNTIPTVDNYETVDMEQVVKFIKQQQYEGKWPLLSGGTGIGKSTKIMLELALRVHLVEKRGTNTLITVCMPSIICVKSISVYVMTLVEGNEKYRKNIRITSRSGGEATTGMLSSTAKCTIHYCTYGSALANWDSTLSESDYIIFDEVHTVDHAPLKAFEAICEEKKYKKVIAITATPIPNKRYAAYSLPSTRRFPVKVEDLKCWNEGSEGIKVIPSNEKRDAYEIPKGMTGRTIIIHATKRHCQLQAENLKNQGLNAVICHSEKMESWDNFKDVFICATPILESGITVDDAENIIDFGEQNIRVSNLDINDIGANFVVSYEIVSINKNQQDQRIGRVGRVKPGKYWVRPSFNPTAPKFFIQDVCIEAGHLLIGILSYNTDRDYSQEDNDVLKYFGVLHPNSPNMKNIYKDKSESDADYENRMIRRAALSRNMRGDSPVAWYLSPAYPVILDYLGDYILEDANGNSTKGTYPSSRVLDLDTMTRIMEFKKITLNCSPFKQFSHLEEAKFVQEFQKADRKEQDDMVCENLGLTSRRVKTFSTYSYDMIFNSVNATWLLALGAAGYSAYHLHRANNEDRVVTRLYQWSTSDNKDCSTLRFLRGMHYNDKDRHEELARKLQRFSSSIPGKFKRTFMKCISLMASKSGDEQLQREVTGINAYSFDDYLYIVKEWVDQVIALLGTVDFTQIEDFSSYFSFLPVALFFQKACENYGEVFTTVLTSVISIFSMQALGLNKYIWMAGISCLYRFASNAIFLSPRQTDYSFNMMMAMGAIPFGYNAVKIFFEQRDLSLEKIQKSLPQGVTLVGATAHKTTFMQIMLNSEGGTASGYMAAKSILDLYDRLSHEDYSANKPGWMENIVQALIAAYATTSLSLKGWVTAAITIVVDYTIGIVLDWLEDTKDSNLGNIRQANISTDMWNRANARKESKVTMLRRIHQMVSIAVGSVMNPMHIPFTVVNLVVQIIQERKNNGKIPDLNTLLRIAERGVFTCPLVSIVTISYAFYSLAGQGFSLLNTIPSVDDLSRRVLTSMTFSKDQSAWDVAWLYVKSTLVTAWEGLKNLIDLVAIRPLMAFLNSILSLLRTMKDALCNVGEKVSEAVSNSVWSIFVKSFTPKTISTWILKERKSKDIDYSVCKDANQVFRNLKEFGLDSICKYLERRVRHMPDINIINEWMPSISIESLTLVRFLNQMKIHTVDSEVNEYFAVVRPSRSLYAIQVSVGQEAKCLEDILFRMFGKFCSNILNVLPDTEPSDEAWQRVNSRAICTVIAGHESFFSGSHNTGDLCISFADGDSKHFYMLLIGQTDNIYPGKMILLTDDTRFNHHGVWTNLCEPIYEAVKCNVVHQTQKDEISVKNQLDLNRFNQLVAKISHCISSQELEEKFRIIIDLIFNKSMWHQISMSELDEKDALLAMLKCINTNDPHWYDELTFACPPWGYLNQFCSVVEVVGPPAYNGTEDTWDIQHLSGCKPNNGIHTLFNRLLRWYTQTEVTMTIINIVTGNTVYWKHDNKWYSSHLYSSCRCWIVFENGCFKQSTNSCRRAKRLPLVRSPCVAKKASLKDHTIAELVKKNNVKWEMEVSPITVLEVNELNITHIPGASKTLKAFVEGRINMMELAANDIKINFAISGKVDYMRLTTADEDDVFVPLEHFLDTRIDWTGPEMSCIIFWYEVDTARQRVMLSSMIVSCAVLEPTPYYVIDVVTKMGAYVPDLIARMFTFLNSERFGIIVLGNEKIEISNGIVRSLANNVSIPFYELTGKEITVNCTRVGVSEKPNVRQVKTSLTIERETKNIDITGVIDYNCASWTACYKNQQITIKSDAHLHRTKPVYNVKCLINDELECAVVDMMRNKTLTKRQNQIISAVRKGHTIPDQKYVPLPANSMTDGLKFEHRAIAAVQRTSDNFISLVSDPFAKQRIAKALRCLTKAKGRETPSIKTPSLKIIDEVEFYDIDEADPEVQKVNEAVHQAIDEIKNSVDVGPKPWGSKQEYPSSEEDSSETYTTVAEVHREAKTYSRDSALCKIVKTITNAFGGNNLVREHQVIDTAEKMGLNYQQGEFFAHGKITSEVATALVEQTAPETTLFSLDMQSIVHFDCLSTRKLKWNYEKHIEWEEKIRCDEAEKLPQGFSIVPLHSTQKVGEVLKTTGEIEHQVLAKLNGLLKDRSIFEVLKRKGRAFLPNNASLGTVSMGFFKAAAFNGDTGILSRCRVMGNPTSGSNGFELLYCTLNPRKGLRHLVFSTLIRSGHSEPILEPVMVKANENNVNVVPIMPQGSNCDLRLRDVFNHYKHFAETQHRFDLLTFDFGEANENLSKESNYLWEKHTIKDFSKVDTIASTFAEAIFEYNTLLQEGGFSVIKLMGFKKGTREIIKELSKNFSGIFAYKMPTSSYMSREWYIVCCGYHAKQTKAWSNIDSWVDRIEHIWATQLLHFKNWVEANVNIFKKDLKDNGADGIGLGLKSRPQTQKEVLEAHKTSDNDHMHNCRVCGKTYIHSHRYFKENHAQQDYQCAYPECKMFYGYGKENNKTNSRQIKIKDRYELPKSRPVVPVYTFSWKSPWKNEWVKIGPETLAALVEMRAYKSVAGSMYDWIAARGKDKFVLLEGTKDELVFNFNIKNRLASVLNLAQDRGWNVLPPSGRFKKVVEVCRLDFKLNFGKEKHTANWLIADMMFNLFGLIPETSVIGHTQCTEEYINSAHTKRLDLDPVEPNVADTIVLLESMRAHETPEYRNIKNGPDHKKFKPLQFHELEGLINNRGAGGHFDICSNFKEFYNHPDTEVAFNKRMDDIAHGRAIPTYQTCRDKRETKAKKGLDASAQLLFEDGTLSVHHPLWKSLSSDRKKERRMARREILKLSTKISPRNIRYAEFIQRLVDLAILGPYQHYHNNIAKLYMGSTTGTPLWKLGSLVRGIYELYCGLQEKELLVGDEILEANRQELSSEYLKSFDTRNIKFQLYSDDHAANKLKQLRNALYCAIASGDFSGWDGTLNNTDHALECLHTLGVYQEKYRTLIINRYSLYMCSITITDLGNVIVSWGQRGSGDQATSSGNTNFNDALHTGAAGTCGAYRGVHDASKILGEIWYRVGFEKDFDPAADIEFKKNHYKQTGEWLKGMWKCYYIRGISHIADGDDNNHFGTPEEIKLLTENGVRFITRNGKKIRCGERTGYEMGKTFSQLSFCSHKFVRVRKSVKNSKMFSQVPLNRLPINDPRRPTRMGEMKRIDDRLMKKTIEIIDNYQEMLLKKSYDSLTGNELYLLNYPSKDGWFTKAKRDKFIPDGWTMIHQRIYEALNDVTVEYLPERRLPEILGKLTYTIKNEVIYFTLDRGYSTENKKDRKAAERNERAIEITRGKALAYLLNYVHIETVRKLVYTIMACIGDGICDLTELKRKGIHAPSTTKSLESSLKSVFDINSIEEIETVSRNYDREGLKTVRNNSREVFEQGTILKEDGMIQRICPTDPVDLKERCLQWLDDFCLRQKVQPDPFFRKKLIDSDKLNLTIQEEVQPVITRPKSKIHQFLLTFLTLSSFKILNVPQEGNILVGLTTDLYQAEILGEKLGYAHFKNDLIEELRFKPQVGDFCDFNHNDRKIRVLFVGKNSRSQLNVGKIRDWVREASKDFKNMNIIQAGALRPNLIAKLNLIIPAIKI